MIELLTNNHLDKILDLFDGVQKEVKIISPFLTMSMAEKLCEVKKEKGVSCEFITRFYLEDMIAKANSMDAIELMMDNGINVYAVKRLHTKLYLFDRNYAILGSANFTNGGFKSNIELSLLVSDEGVLISELQGYFDDMVSQIKPLEEGRITKEMLSKARELYMNLFKAKKNAGSGTVRSMKMYGAALNNKGDFKDTNAALKELDECAKEKDLICELFKETEQVEQIKFPYTIWLKFDGEGNDRIASGDTFPMTSVKINGKTAYLSNYPFKVGSIKDNDEVYFGAISTDKHGKNQPIIVGRGHLAGFTEENQVNDTMIAKYEWMTRYPWYCIIKDCELLNTSVINGIPMDTVWDALGSDTYVSSFGRNEDIAAVGRKHYQKAHIRLSGNAKIYIDKKLDALKAQYGVIEYRSEV